MINFRPEIVPLFQWYMHFLLAPELVWFIYYSSNLITNILTSTESKFNGPQAMRDIWFPQPNLREKANKKHDNIIQKKHKKALWVLHTLRLEYILWSHYVVWADPILFFLSVMAMDSHSCLQLPSAEDKCFCLLNTEITVLCHHTQLRIMNLNSSILKFIESFLSLAATLCLAWFPPRFYY